MPVAADGGVPPGERDLRGDAAVGAFVAQFGAASPRLREVTNATVNAACAAAHADLIRSSSLIWSINSPSAARVSTSVNRSTQAANSCGVTVVADLDSIIRSILCIERHMSRSDAVTSGASTQNGLPTGTRDTDSDVWMSSMTENDVPRVVSASREIAAGSSRIFEFIADPALQPRWDGNDNLAEAAAGQRIRKVGDVFVMTLTNGAIRENQVVEFDEGRRLAWRPAEPGQQPPGHLWRWELEPIDGSRTVVTHTYDWSDLKDEKRRTRARATTDDKLQASLDRLAAVAEE